MSQNLEEGATAEQRRRWVLLTSVVAALGGFLFGYDTGVISGAILYIEDDFPLTAFTEGCVVSGLLIGAALGALAAGAAADRYGRRKTLGATAVVFLLGVAIAALAPTLFVLIAGRFVLGIGVGAAAVTVPLYIGELAPPETRGRLVSLNQLMITSGIVVAYLVGYALSEAEAWRWMVAAAAVPSFALLLGMARMPESPRWLLAHGRVDDAKVVLAKTLDRETAQAEMDAMADAGLPKRNYRALLAPALRPAMVIGIGLAVLQQLVGINTVIYYAPTILERTGVGSSNAILNSVIIGVVNVVMTLVSIRLVDRVGRRPLLLVSLAGMVVTLVVGGLAFELKSLGDVQDVVTLLALVLYVAFFAVGMGPIFWLMMAEVFPTEHRSEAASIATAANWLANFAVALLFPTVVDAIGQGPTFWIFGAICAVGIVFVLRLVPETKDRTLEEVEAELRGRVRPAV